MRNGDIDLAADSHAVTLGWVPFPRSDSGNEWRYYGRWLDKTRRLLFTG
jgi:hypothetical protein